MLQPSRVAAKNRLLAALPGPDRRHLLARCQNVLRLADPARGAHSPCLLPHRQLHLSDHSDRRPRGPQVGLVGDEGTRKGGTVELYSAL